MTDEHQKPVAEMDLAEVKKELAGVLVSLSLEGLAPLLDVRALRRRQDELDARLFELNPEYFRC